MRADAAAIGREADHQVVEARIRQEAEAVHQGSGRRQVKVDALDEQASSPVAAGAAGG